MRIEEAIEIKETYLKGNEAVDHYEHLEADRLSIEALKMVKEQRCTAQRIIHRPLPGETNESRR